MLEKGLGEDIDNIISGEELHSDAQGGDRRYQHLAQPQLPFTTIATSASAVQSG